MFKILFVDDDAIARTNISNRLDWNHHGWDLVYTAKDAVDALDYIKKNQPDLVISDIKMPVMDGIQMATIARDYYPNLKFIFLTGYRDFEYAKKALQLNALDYLDKPVETNQLFKVISHAEQFIITENKKNQVLEKNYPLIKRHYISQLIFNNFQEADEASFRAFDFNLDNGFGVVAFLDFSAAESPVLFNDFCSHMNHLHLGSFFMPMEDSQIFLLFTANNISSEDDFKLLLKDLETEASHYFQTRLKQPISYYYGSIFQELSGIYDSYQESLHVRSQHTTGLLHDVKFYIQNNYSNPNLTLKQVSSHFNINNCYLTSLFKERFGTNLYDYLIQIRMEKAGELIRTTSLKGYQIADHVGYNNSQYFSISFKKYFGYTLTDYKNKLL